MPGTLYLVATPIGNLKDITYRAVEILRSVDIIACEDTRHTGKLLTHLDISNKLRSYHAHNEQERSQELGELLASGAAIAVVSDAGTPGINDPGLRLVKKAIEVGAIVVPVPGAIAFVNAAVASGLATDSIFFAGFLPSKKSERRKRLEEVRSIPGTLVFYETPHRISAALADCRDVLGDRHAAVARELTKLHEEIVRGPLSELHIHFSSANSRGEFVLVIDRERDGGPAQQSPGRSLTQRIAELESEGLDHKAALKRAAKEFGLTRSDAYREWQLNKGPS
jgi:16S rRNA (cytidine1402-2'-O)-methyltransferase